MPSIHTSLPFHLVFSTKDRRPVIAKPWRDRLHAYLGGIVKGLGCLPLAVGGVQDHVHLLVGLTASHRVDYFLRDLKPSLQNGCIRRSGKRPSVGKRAMELLPSVHRVLKGVKRYVLNQEKHHQRKTFQEEYVELLTASEIEYDERYVW